MPNVYDTKSANLIFENSLKAFGLNKEAKSDPEIIKNVIDEFELASFKTGNEYMASFLKEAVSQPQDLSPLINNIKKGITTKHHAILEFAELALSKNWFKPSTHITRTLHCIFILESLTAAMCNDHDFFVEIQDHYKKQEKIRGIDSKHILTAIIRALGITHNLFGTIKAFLIDPGMIYFRTQRGLSKSLFDKDELKKLYKNGDINYMEYKMLWPTQKYGLEHLHTLIRINIYEAGITEYKNGYKANSISAHDLAEDIRKNPPLTLFKNKSVVPENNTDNFYSKIVRSNNSFPVFEFSQDWVSLYTTWNMAFVLGDIGDLDILFPKLLIPSIINAESENFLGVRIVSLWLTVNHYMFRKYDNKNVIGPNNKKEMAKAWGEINKKYAYGFAKRALHESPRLFTESYKRFFSKPFYNLLKIIKLFIFKK